MQLHCSAQELLIFAPTPWELTAAWPDANLMPKAVCSTLHLASWQVEPHKSSGAMRGYIAMLVVQKPYRGAGTGEASHTVA